MSVEPYAIAQAENLVSILAHDDTNGRIVANLVEPQLFQGDLREIAERLVAYWKRYDKAPKLHAADLFSDIIEDKNNRRANSFIRILNNMSSVIEGVNVDYVLHTLKTEMRVAKMQDGILRAAETISAKRHLGIEEAETILSELLRAREFNFEKGSTLRDVNKVVDFVTSRSVEFSMGIDPLDQRGIVPMRGALMMIVAPSGKGKSWALMHIGKHAIMQRKRVLYVTLEMPEYEILQRYYQSFFAVTRFEAEAEVVDIDVDEHGKLKKIGKLQTLKPSFTYADTMVRSKLRKAIDVIERTQKTNLFADRLLVKEFPTRRLTVGRLEAYLDTLDAMGFTPDLLLLDYVGLMHTDVKDFRVSLGRTAEDLRGLAAERKIALVTAHQSNRKGADAAIVRATDVAEDWSLVATSDVVLTYTRTEAEKKYGLARLIVGKSRSREDGWGVVLTQAYAMGQFAIKAAVLKDPGPVVTIEAKDDDED